MPHILFDMDTAADAMIGNASSGSSIKDLKTCYHAVDALIGNSTIEISDQAHDFCDKVSDFLLGSFEPSGHGAKYDIDAMIVEGNAILNA